MARLFEWLVCGCAECGRLGALSLELDRPCGPGDLWLNVVRTDGDYVTKRRATIWGLPAASF